MERLNLKLKDTQRALTTLNEILKEPYSIIIRDASIQRFEYTFEAFWKFLKEFLKTKKGIIANSPKDCFRAIFSLGLTSEEETEGLLKMTDSRNETTHTYKEEIANKIYSNVKNYAELMNNVTSKIAKD